MDYQTLVEATVPVSAGVLSRFRITDPRLRQTRTCTRCPVAEESKYILLEIKVALSRTCTRYQYKGADLLERKRGPTNAARASLLLQDGLLNDEIEIEGKE